jgi:adenylosuccinate lyase
MPIQSAVSSTKDIENNFCFKYGDVMIERYSLPELAAIWTDEARYQRWLRVELAACEAMAKFRVIPRESFERLQKKAKVDAKKIAAHEAVVKHDMIAFTMSIEELVGKDAQYFHFGLTSSDVLDTALALQMRDSAILIIAELKGVMAALKRLSIRTKKLPTIGRSHGIHAEPMSFGQKFISFYAEMKRNLSRLERARDGISYGMFSGAVGSYGTLSPKIEAEACRILGLKAEPVSTQVIPRDRHAEFFNALALLGAGIERISVELRHLQRTEVSEVEEGFDKGQKGSSAMPHKKNPISAENLTGCARLLRSWSNAALENVALWHERDISHSSVERVIGPDACILSHYMLVRMKKLLDQLVVNEKKVKENLGQTRGIVYSGALLLAFVRKGMPRDTAYRLVQKHALASWQGGANLEERLTIDRDALTYLSKEEIHAEFSDSRGLEHVEDIFSRVL